MAEGFVGGSGFQGGSTVIPSFRYRDAHAAIEWLERVLGFTRHAVYVGEDKKVEHAELRHGSGGMVMLGSVSERNAEHYAAPEEIGGRVTSPIYVVVADCGPVWERAKAAGAAVVMELQVMSYGGQAFGVRDPEGFYWSVGEYDPWKALEAATEPGATESASNGA